MKNEAVLYSFWLNNFDKKVDKLNRNFYLKGL